MTATIDYFDEENVTPTDVVAALEGWSRQARKDSEAALAADQVGKAARLYGKSQGLALAAAEMRRRLPITENHVGPHGSWYSGAINFGMIRTASNGKREERSA